MEKNNFAKLFGITAAIFLTSCSSLYSSNYEQIATPHSTYHTAMINGNSAEIWDKLQHTPKKKLLAMQTKITEPIEKEWIELSLISKQDSINTQQLAQKLMAWRANHPTHPGNALFPENSKLNQIASSPAPQRIAILLPQRGPFAPSGQKIREGFLNAYYKFAPKGSKQNIRFYDTTKTTNMNLLYQQATAEGADFIIGPLVKSEVQQLKSSGSFHSPTLALNYADIAKHAALSNFYEFGLLPEDETKQMAKRANEAGYSKAIIIAPQNAWGKRLVSAFSSKWQEIGGTIQEAWFYSQHANFNQDVAKLLNINTEADKKLMEEENDKEVLAQQRRQDFDVIFLFAQPHEARVIVPLLKYYYANNIPIFATSSVYFRANNSGKDIDLNGVTICDIPWKKHFAQTQHGDELQSNRLYAVGQDAYILSQTLSRLTMLPNFPIYGTTGALTISNNHQIHRRLPCKTIRNGII